MLMGVGGVGLTPEDCFSPKTLALHVLNVIVGLTQENKSCLNLFYLCGESYETIFSFFSYLRLKIL